MRDVKTIFLDAAGTLIHLPRGVGFHYARVAARFGWSVEEEIIGSAFRNVWKQMPLRAATKEPRPDDDRGWWRELVKCVLDRCNVPSGFDRDEYFCAVYEEFRKPGVWSLYPEVAEVLDALSAEFQLAVLSNFDGRLRAVLADLGVLSRFTETVISSEAGADKPDPWIFEFALKKIGGRADETLLVGDDEERDIAGARRAGWHALHIDRPKTNLLAILPALNARRSAP